MSVADREKEFNANVWDHSRDSFQTEFDLCPDLTPDEVKLLERLVELVREEAPDAVISKELRNAIRKNGLRVLEMVLQLIGLTRNKILQDLKASHSAVRGSLRLTNHEALINHDNTWTTAAGPYLAVRLRRVLGPLGKGGRDAAFQALAQATWPGYIRQERAKRSGHEAEHRGALLLHKCNVPFEPEEKVENPLCRDVQINGVSFDLVVPNTSKPLVCVKATVHTANIGQYGESKDALEMDEARRMIDANFKAGSKPILVGLVDGVGFESNRAGLRGVLEKSDEFCQFKTIWKLAVIALHALKRDFHLYLPRASIEAHAAFLKRYSVSAKEITAVEEGSPDENAVVAGEAHLVIG